MPRLVRRTHLRSSAPLRGACLLAAIASCSGRIEERPGADVEDRPPASPGGAPRDDRGPPAGGMGRPADLAGGPVSCDEAQRPTGDTPLRRLTRAQYARTVRDLLGVESDVHLSFPEDDRVGPFPANPAQPVSELHARRYMDAAETISRAAVARLDKLAPSCNGADACVRSFVQSLGRRAFRRPVTQAELDGLLAVYATGREGGTFADGARLVLEAILQAPQFLYLVERKSASASAGARRVPLDGHELAARLSYFLWGTMPDDALMTAAAAGELATSEGLRRQAERLVADPRARESTATLGLHLLDVTGLDRVAKNPKRFLRFDVVARDAMKAETVEFFDYVVRRGDGSLATLLTAPFSFVDRALLPIYGLGVPTTYDATKPVALVPQQRAGVLTQASVLASHSGSDHTSPVKRGHFILKNLLCLDIPVPDFEVPALPEPDPRQTNRQRFAAHTSNPGCAACHKMIDPIGFGFERYDAVGAYRELEDGKPVDARGELAIGNPVVDGPFEGAPALAAKLLAAKELHDCLPTQWQRFALGRRETPADACSLGELRRDFAASGFDLRELALSLVTKDSFRFRPVAPVKN